jgi:hypothetical protein
MRIPESAGAAQIGRILMRQASWIAFLLLAVGLLSYEASLDQEQGTSASNATVQEMADGELPPPKP